MTSVRRRRRLCERCATWCGENWVMQPDQSCPSDSTSLGTSSKGRCSLATRRGSTLTWKNSTSDPSCRAPYCLHHPAFLQRKHSDWLHRSDQVSLSLTTFYLSELTFDNWQLVSLIRHSTSSWIRRLSNPLCTASLERRRATIRFQAQSRSGRGGRNVKDTISRYSTSCRDPSSPVTCIAPPL